MRLILLLLLFMGCTSDSDIESSAGNDVLQLDVRYSEDEPCESLYELASISESQFRGCIPFNFDVTYLDVGHIEFCFDDFVTVLSVVGLREFNDEIKIDADITYDNNCVGMKLTVANDMNAFVNGFVATIFIDI